MTSFTLRAARGAIALAAGVLAACHDPIAAGDSVRPSIAANAASAATADATLAWNEVARDLVAKYATSAPASIRTFALLSVAQHNAIVAAERDVEREPGRASDRGAIASSVRTVGPYVAQNSAAVSAGACG